MQVYNTTCEVHQLAVVSTHRAGERRPISMSCWVIAMTGRTTFKTDNKSRTEITGVLQSIGVPHGGGRSATNPAQEMARMILAGEGLSLNVDQGLVIGVYLSQDREWYRSPDTDYSSTRQTQIRYRSRSSSVSSCYATVPSDTQYRHPPSTPYGRAESPDSRYRTGSVRQLSPHNAYFHRPSTHISPVHMDRVQRDRDSDSGMPYEGLRTTTRHGAERFFHDEGRSFGRIDGRRGNDHEGLDVHYRHESRHGGTTQRSNRYAPTGYDELDGDTGWLSNPNCT
jgi:hypothetical protein